MDRRKLCLARPETGLLLLGLLVLAAAPTGVLGQPANDFVGRDACLGCHDGMAAGFAQSTHGRLQPYQYPGGGEGCESCHGPGGRHADSSDPSEIFLPAAELGGDGNENCLACHRTGHAVDWQLSAHAAAGVSCLACHSIHEGRSGRALLAGREEDLCFSCHQDLRSKFMLPSHHPLKEGFLTCSSCHDAHGDSYRNVAAGETGREACLDCHAEHAGPFIFEHSPVMEDCGICHDVHGSVANNLLVQNEPFLCLQCHQPHFHSILAGEDQEDWAVPGAVSGADPDYAGLTLDSDQHSLKAVMLTKCTQCHQSIHGTDLPSQSITGQGRALNR